MLLLRLRFRHIIIISSRIRRILPRITIRPILRLIIIRRTVIHRDHICIVHRHLRIRRRVIIMCRIMRRSILRRRLRRIMLRIISSLYSISIISSIIRRLRILLRYRRRRRLCIRRVRIRIRHHQ